MPQLAASRVTTEELLLAAHHLSALAEAAHGYVADETLVVGAGSGAAIERDDAQYDGAWGPASQMVSLDVVPRLVAIVDHVRAFATLTGAPGVGVALASLVRPTLDGLATLSWLYDPATSSRERVRRRFNLRLKSLAQEQNVSLVASGPGGDFQEAIDAIALEAKRQGFKFTLPRTSRAGIIVPGHLDQEIPKDEVLVRLLTAPAGTSSDIGALLYRRTSAVVHGQAHGLHPFVIVSSPGSIPGTARLEIGLPSSWFSVMALSVVAALNATMIRLINHYGWEPSDWADVSREAMDRWAMPLAASLATS